MTYLHSLKASNSGCCNHLNFLLTMRKAIFLGAFLLAVGAFTSCNKDGLRGPEENLKSVDGTEWISSKGTIKFRNGKYSIDCRVPGWGTYTQNGRHITFDGNSVSIGGGSVKLKSGELTKYGDSMTVTFVDNSYWNTGETETVLFTYNISAE